MYLIEVEFYSWADMSNSKADSIDGFFAIFTVSEEDYDQFIEESENRDDVKKYTILRYIETV